VLGFVCMHVYCRCISFIHAPRRSLLFSYFLQAAMYRNEDDTTTNLHINVQTCSIPTLALDICTRNESLGVTLCQRGLYSLTSIHYISIPLSASSWVLRTGVCRKQHHKNAVAGMSYLHLRIPTKLPLLMHRAIHDSLLPPPSLGMRMLRDLVSDSLPAS